MTRTPSALRRAVLERDRHHCRWPGCRANRAWLDWLRAKLFAQLAARPRKIGKLLARWKITRDPGWGLEVDHITEAQAGGGHTLANLQTLCIFHHAAKSRLRNRLRVKEPRKGFDAGGGMTVAACGASQGVAMKLAALLRERPDLRARVARLMRAPVREPVQAAKPRRHFTEAEFQAAAARREEYQGDEPC